MHHAIATTFVWAMVTVDYGDVCGFKSSDDNSCEGRCDDGKNLQTFI